jgi:hypothetical protein
LALKTFPDLIQKKFPPRISGGWTETRLKVTDLWLRVRGGGPLDIGLLRHLRSDLNADLPAEADIELGNEIKRH